jgi:cytochrome c oxidase cbb3-type subunit 3
MSSRCREIAASLLLLTLAGCERESRRFYENAAAAAPLQSVSLSELHPGGQPLGPEHAQAPAGGVSPYDGNAYEVSQGKQLFEWMNCKGCHADGGGSIGPALMDEKWIYGAEPDNLFATIVEGRPNGMPSFRGRLSAQQVWQLVAYVRSLSGQLRKDVEPSRSDHLFTRKSESSGSRMTPVPSSPPPPQ